jgi:hypothetical protein
MSAQIQSTMLSILQFTPPGTTLPVELFPAVESLDDQYDESPKYQFGVLEINTPDKDALPHTWDVKFDVDCSGSMSDPCMDGRTKMHHIKHVLTNILRLFASYGHITFNVSIDAFDDRISNIFDFVQITSDNVELYIAKINGIHPRCQTNLVLPLENTKRQMSDRASAFPSNKRLHFLLTDGNDTCNNSSKKIVNTVDAQYDTIVFGFGQDHDSKTLMEIGEKPFCEYAFIAELEKAGIVYGEYIHNVLYRYVEGLTVLLRDAEIYCWKTNSWSPSLVIGNLASGMKKSYYLRTIKSVETVSGEIYGRQCTLDNDGEFIKLDDFVQMPHLISEDGEIQANEFKDHSLRFNTLELLYEVAHLEDDEAINTKNDSLYNGFLSRLVTHRKKSKNYYDKAKVLKEKILALYRKIRDYKVATYGETDPNTFLTALMDDLYIARRSFDHTNGRLYTMARQRTQGTQNVYTPSNIDYMGYDQPTRSLSAWPLGDEDDESQYLCNSSSLRRLTCASTLPHPFRQVGNCPAMFGVDETDILSHNISCGTQDIYSTPRMLEVIRSTSDAVGENDLV